jgi:8-amino-7-oxononanoate synthase
MPMVTAPVTARDRLLAELAEELAARERAGLSRRLSMIEAVDGPRCVIEGREVVCWCANDYLGLSRHPALIRQAAQAAAEWGIGARASRLLAGTTRWHERLEAALAAWFGAEAALVYSSGYLANLGTLRALVAAQDALFVDRLAHASLVDACRATGAHLLVFRHNDPSHLAALLERAAGARRRIIVTEGLFSMEGDRAPLEALVALARAHEALVYLDDAHGAFVLGPTGRGACEAAGVAVSDVLYMGTLGKALGCQGGFVVGPRTLIEGLRNRARTLIYSTALAVPVAAAATAGLRLLAQEPEHRDRLWQRVGELDARLRPLGYAAGSPIVPITVGSPHAALALAEQLWRRGCWAPAIRPPTVPQGTARIRLSLTALHTEPQIASLAEALADALALPAPHPPTSHAHATT